VGCEDRELVCLTKPEVSAPLSKSPRRYLLTFKVMAAVRTMPLPVAVTVTPLLPTLAPVALVRVRVARPLPGDARLEELRLALIPLGAPETLRAIGDANPPNTVVVIVTDALVLVPLTDTVAGLAIRVNPGTLTVTLVALEIPPPAAVIATA
jgi:hypothetical protein